MVWRTVRRKLFLNSTLHDKKKSHWSLIAAAHQLSTKLIVIVRRWQLKRVALLKIGPGQLANWIALFVGGRWRLTDDHVGQLIVAAYMKQRVVARARLISLTATAG